MWYKLVEQMDLSSIYHKHSPRLNQRHAKQPVPKVKRERTSLIGESSPTDSELEDRPAAKSGVQDGTDRIGRILAFRVAQHLQCGLGSLPTAFCRPYGTSSVPQRSSSRSVLVWCCLTNLVRMSSFSFHSRRISMKPEGQRIVFHSG